MSDDFNRMNQIREVQAHQSSVTAVHYATNSDWVISGGRDKVFQYYSCQTGKHINSYISNSWCTALAYPFFFNSCIYNHNRIFPEIYIYIFKVVYLSKFLDLKLF